MRDGVRRRKVDELTISDATGKAKRTIEYATQNYINLTTDPQKDERLSSCLCVPCFYTGPIGGAVITSEACATCGEVSLYPSTYTDILCYACAYQHGLCKHCGADIELKFRRKP